MTEAKRLALGLLCLMLGIASLLVDGILLPAAAILCGIACFAIALRSKP